MHCIKLYSFDWQWKKLNFTFKIVFAMFLNVFEIMRAILISIFFTKIKTIFLFKFVFLLKTNQIKTQKMNWKNIVIKYVCFRIFVLILQIDSAKTMKMLNLSNNFFFKMFQMMFSNELCIYDYFEIFAFKRKNQIVFW